MDEELKACSRCGESRPLAEFLLRRSRNSRDGACKSCRRAAGKAYRQRLAQREVIERPEFHRCSHCKQTLPGTAFALSRTKERGIQNICLACYRARRFGLEVGQYEGMLADQGGVCAICHQKCPRGGELSVDHDHKTGLVRGLLCQRCNAGLGLFHDDQSRINGAIAYLKSAVGDA